MPHYRIAYHAPEHAPDPGAIVEVLEFESIDTPLALPALLASVSEIVGYWPTDWRERASITLVEASDVDGCERSRIVGATGSARRWLMPAQAPEIPAGVCADTLARHAEIDRIARAAAPMECQERGRERIRETLLSGRPGTLAFLARYFPRRPARVYRTAEDSEWAEREEQRFCDGSYDARPLPWADEAWWQTSDAARWHFAHPAQKDPAKIAYTESRREGRDDRRTVTRPGRYLNRWFGEALAPEDIQYWAQRYAGEFETHSASFATTPDEIQTVYANGPRSCMSDCEAVRVYGAGDLAIAYLGPIDDASARAVCWPERKVYLGPYGDSERLSAALRADGFERAGSGDFEGARLLKIEVGGGYLAPYFDGSEGVRIESDYLILTRGGDSLESTSGIIGGQRCDRCDETDTPENGRSVGNDWWCESCYQGYAFYCEGCEESVDAEGSREVFFLYRGRNRSSQHYCECCANENVKRCGDCGEHWKEEDAVYLGDNWPSGKDWVCPDCAENYSYCEACEEYASETDDVRTGEGCNDREQWCAECARADATDCPECDETVADSVGTEHAGVIYCPDCGPEIRDAAVSDWEAWERVRPVALLPAGAIVGPVALLPAMTSAPVEIELRSTRTRVVGWNAGHPCLVAHAELDCEGFAVSHIPTGLVAKRGFESLNAALQFGARVASAPWGYWPADREPTLEVRDACREAIQKATYTPV